MQFCKSVSSPPNSRSTRRMACLRSCLVESLQMFQFSVEFRSSLSICIGLCLSIPGENSCGFRITLDNVVKFCLLTATYY